MSPLKVGSTDWMNTLCSTMHIGSTSGLYEWTVVYMTYVPMTEH